MDRAVRLYEEGKDDDGLDLFMDVLVQGDPSQKALANDYLNRITKRMSEGEQRVPASLAPGVSAPRALRGPASLTEKPQRNQGDSARPAGVPLGAAGPGGRPDQRRSEMVRSEIDNKLAMIRRRLLDGLRAQPDLRVAQPGDLPEGVAVPTSMMFEADIRFRPGSERLLASLAALAYTIGDASVVVLPEGYRNNESKVLDMRRAMALRSYLTARGLSPARVRASLIGNEVTLPARLSEVAGPTMVFQYGKPIKLVAEGPIEPEAGPPISLGVWPDSLRVGKTEGILIEFSVLDQANGVASWRFEMLMPTIEGGEESSVLQEVVGDSPVLHQVFWNGRRNYFGDPLPYGRYQASLKARSLRGKETVLRQEIMVEREGAAPAPVRPPAPPPASKPAAQLAKGPRPSPKTPARKVSRRLRDSKLPIDVALAPAEGFRPARRAEPEPEEEPRPKLQPPAKEKEAVLAKGGVVNFEIYFDKDSMEIGNEKVLQQVPANLRHYPLASLNLVGYAFAGERDPASLAEKRVQVVADLLVQKYRVERSKIQTQTQVAEDENTNVQIYISQASR